MIQHDARQHQALAERKLGAGAALGIAMLFASSNASAGSATPSGGPLPALFTAREAGQGRIVFEQQCAGCHGDNLRGKIGPAIIGPSLGSVADHTTVSIMFNVIAAEMPAGAPASLSHQDYTEVMAYLLQRNGYPAGAHPLSYAAVEAADVPLISQVR